MNANPVLRRRGLSRLAVAVTTAATLTAMLVALPAAVAKSQSSSPAAAAPPCDKTVKWGHTLSFSGTTPQTLTVCLDGTDGRADPLLDVRATPAAPTDSVQLELDKTDGTYLRSSRAGEAGAKQRVGLASLQEKAYSVDVTSPIVGALGVSVDAGVPYVGTISIGPAPTTNVKQFAAPALLPSSGDGEPSIAVDRNHGDTEFVTAPVGVPSAVNPIATGNGTGGVDYWRSNGNGGFDYQNISLGNGGGDSHVAVDSAGYVYIADLALSNINLLKSNEVGGKTFMQLPPAGNTTADREWLAPYLPDASQGTSSTVLHLSYHDFAAEEFWECTGPAGGTITAACAPIVPQNDPSLFTTAAGNTVIGPQVVLPGGGLAMLATTSTTAENATNATTGPMDHLYSIVSTDGGTTWNAYPVGDFATGTSVTNIFPVMTKDTAGNLYAVWSQQNPDKAGSPSGPTTVYLSSSTDKGKTWTTKARVNPAGINSGVLPWVVATQPGQVDIVYVGSTAHDPADTTATWYTYMTQSTNALATSPTFRTMPVTPNPVRYGQVCVSGILCSEQGDEGRSLLDFISVDLDSAGCAVVAIPSSANEATYPSGDEMITQTFVAHQRTDCLHWT